MLMFIRQRKYNSIWHLNSGKGTFSESFWLELVSGSIFYARFAVDGSNIVYEVASRQEMPPIFSQLELSLFTTIPLSSMEILRSKSQHGVKGLN